LAAANSRQVAINHGSKELLLITYLDQKRGWPPDGGQPDFD
jgi:hypothetical protein